MRESDPRRSLHGTGALKAHTWFQQPSQLPYCLARTAWSFELISGSQLRCLWPAGRSCIFAPEIICSPFPLRHPAGWLIPGAVLLLAGGSLLLLRGAYSANHGILDQPGDRLMARRLATCGSFQCSKNPMSLGAMVLSPGVGPIPFVPIDPVVCRASIFVLSRPGCICGRAEARKWFRANLSRVKSQQRKKDIGPPTPPTRGIAAPTFWRDAQKLTGGLGMAGPMV